MLANTRIVSLEIFIDVAAIFPFIAAIHPLGNAAIRRLAAKIGNLGNKNRLLPLYQQHEIDMANMARFGGIAIRFTSFLPSKSRFLANMAAAHPTAVFANNRRKYGNLKLTNSTKSRY